MIHTMRTWWSKSKPKTFHMPLDHSLVHFYDDPTQTPKMGINDRSDAHFIEKVSGHMVGVQSGRMYMPIQVVGEPE